MSAVSFPVTRPVGRALLVGTVACRLEPTKLLREQGYDCVEADDPYAAMMQLARQRSAFQMLVLSLASLYREELSLISTVKRRLPHVEIWLAQTDGRVAALAEGVRLGADGFLADDGTLHRVAPPQGERASMHSSGSMPTNAHEPRDLRGETLSPNGAPQNGAAQNSSAQNGSAHAKSNGHGTIRSAGNGTGNGTGQGTGRGTGGTELGDMPQSDEPSNDNVEHRAGHESVEDTLAMGEPVLTADELRALLQDQPSMPPSNAND